MAIFLDDSIFLIPFTTADLLDKAIRNRRLIVKKLQYYLTPLTLIIATAALWSGGPLKLFVVRPGASSSALYLLFTALVSIRESVKEHVCTIKVTVFFKLI